MSDNNTNQPTNAPITTQRESEERGLANLSKNGGGQLQRGDDGLLRMIVPHKPER